MTAEEYKDVTIRNFNGTAADADRQIAFWTKELESCETDAIREATQGLIDTYTALSAFSTAAALALEDVAT